MQDNNPQDSLDLRRYLRIIKGGRLLYIICLAGALVLAVTYALVSKPVYKHYANILVEPDEGSHGGGLSSLLGGAGKGVAGNLFSLSGLGSSTLDDEMRVLSSHDCLLRTVRTLGLNRIYLERHGLSKQMLYRCSPVAVEAPVQYFDTLTTPMKLTVTLEGNGQVSAKLSTGFMGLTTLARVEHQALPCVVSSPAGDLLLVRTEHYTDDAAQRGRKIQVSISGYHGAALALEKDLKMLQIEKKANDILLSLYHPDREYAHDVLRTQVQSYRQMRKEHKNERSQREVAFLDERIGLLMSELDTVQHNMRDFMTGRNMVDVEGQTKLLLVRNEALQDSILKVETRQQLCQMVLDVLNATADDYPTLPALSNDRLIEQYNALVMQRTELRLSAREGNAALDLNTQQLSNLRTLVMDNMRLTLQQQQRVLASMKGELARSASSLGRMPADGLEYLNHERDLQVKNGLLLFLLQQRENAMMSIMSRTEAGYMYEPPYTAKDKDYTKKLVIAALLLLLALLGPTVLVLAWAGWKNLLVDDSDLPRAWRSHGRADVNAMRRLLMADDQIEELYVMPVKGCDAGVAALIDCLGKAGAAYRILPPEDLTTLLELHDVKLSPARRLVMVAGSRQMKRSDFARLVRDVDPTYCYVLCQA